LEPDSVPTEERAPGGGRAVALEPDSVPTEERASGGGRAVAPEPDSVPTEALEPDSVPREEREMTLEGVLEAAMLSWRRYRRQRD